MSFFSWLCVSGHDDHGAVAPRVADQRQADAGIAGGALDDHAAGPQQAASSRRRAMMARAARSLTDCRRD